MPKDYDLIVWLLRQLISTCTHHMRHEAKHYFEVARDELEPFSPASCPMSKDELHWFATQASSRALGRSPTPIPNPSSRPSSRPGQVRHARVEPRGQLLPRA